MKKFSFSESRGKGRTRTYTLTEDQLEDKHIEILASDVIKRFNDLPDGSQEIVWKHMVDAVMREISGDDFINDTKNMN